MVPVLIFMGVVWAGPRVRPGDTIEICWRATDTNLPFAGGEFRCEGQVFAIEETRRRGGITGRMLMDFAKHEVPNYQGGRIWVREVTDLEDPGDSDHKTVWVPPHSDDFFTDFVVHPEKTKALIYLDIDLPMHTR